MRKIVMIYLDGFSSRYLRRAPFLTKVSFLGKCLTLKPMFAFQGIGSSIFSGTTPNTNKVWFDHVYKLHGATASSKLLKYLIALFDLIPSDDLSKYFRHITCNSIMNKGISTPNIIPPALLDFFEPKLVKRYTDDRALGEIVTLFDQLRTYNINCHVSGIFSAIFEKRIVGNLTKISKTDHQLYIEKLSSLDRLGHKFGPESEKVCRKVLEIDEILRRTTQASVRSNNIFFMIFSDHGMVPVLGTVDLFDIVRRLPVKIIQDYMLFINSTVASFWFNNQKARDIVTGALEKIECGEILDQAKLKEQNVDRIGPEYGEVIFGLNEGYVFFPDFYRKRMPPKGMHGYFRQTYDDPFLLLYSPSSSVTYKGRKTAQHIDIMPTVLDLLELPIPASCEGESLVEV